MSSRRLIHVAALAFVCAGGYFAFFSSERAEPDEAEVKVEQPEQPADEKPTPELQGEPIAKEAPPPDEKEFPKGSRFKMPDGSWLPVLNGAYGAPAADWPAERPYSPIIGKETDSKGREWYVHEDGSRTITINVYQSHIGKKGPTTNVYNPEKPLPMAPDELELFKRQKAELEAKKKAEAAKKNG